MTKLGAVAQKLKQIIAVEHSLRLEADPFRAKLIAEAVREYLHKYYQLENNDTSLTDFLYNIEAEYQVINGLDEDNWDFTEADKEKLE